jgi:hypothetical protein
MLLRRGTVLSVSVPVSAGLPAASASAGLLRPRILLAADRFGLCWAASASAGLPAASASAWEGRREQGNTSLTVRVITQSPLGELFLPDRAPFAPTDLE